AEFNYRVPDEACDLTSGIICSPNNFEYEVPLEEGAVRMTTLANPDWWLNVPEEEYSTAKSHWQNQIVAAALRHLPDFRPALVDTDIFTPRTIRKFTGHINGCVYGAPRKHWSGATHLENVFLCGTDQGYLGIIGSMLSGIAMANRHALLQ